MSRVACVLVALSASLVSLTAHADAGPATLTVTSPATAAVDTAFEAVLSYSLQGGTYTNLTLTLPWQADNIFVTSTYAGTFTLDTSTPNTYKWKAASLVVGATGISGDIRVSLKSKRWQVPDGTPLVFGATLSATYTPIGGAAQPVTASSTATSIATATSNLTWWSSGIAGVPDNLHWINHPILGPGLRIRYNLRFKLNGTAQINAGSVLHVDLGSKLYFMAAFSQRGSELNPPSDGTYDITSPPEGTDIPGGVVEGRLVQPLTTANTQVTALYASNFYVDVFVPCTDPNHKALPITLAERDGAAYALTSTVTGYQPLYGGGTRSLPLGPTLGNSGNALMTGACGTSGGTVTLYQDNVPASVNQTAIYQMQARAPSGILRVADAMVAIILPPDVTNARVVMQPASLEQTFDVWYCAVPATPYFSADEFQTNLRGDCEPAWFPGATHIVFDAEAGWGDGNDITMLNADMYWDLPDNWLDLHPSGFLNGVVYLNGKADLDGDGTLETLGDQVPEVGVSDIWEDACPRNVVNGSNPVIDDFTDVYGPGSGFVRQVAQGGYSKIALRLSQYYILSDVINPHLELTVPDGVIIATSNGSAPIVDTYLSGVSGCGPKWTASSSAQPAQRPLHWDFGSAAAPYVLGGQCVMVTINFRLDPTYPWRNGETFSFKGTVTADNSRAPIDAARTNLLTTTFTAVVAAEVRVDVTPDCGAGGSPGFIVATRNTGGVDLTQIETVFSVPRNGVDGTTENGSLTTLSVLDNADTAGLTFEAFTTSDNAWHALTLGQPIPGAYAGATKVRARGLGIVARTAPFRFRLGLAAASGANAKMVGRATTDPAELGLADSGPGDAWVNGQCPGVVDVTKFFDRDRNGARGVGEEALRGWTFTVTNGAKSWTATSGDDGHATFTLLPGNYTISEAVPSGGVTWLPPVGGGFSRSLTMTSGGQVPIVFANACDCPMPANRCQLATCHNDGTCTLADAPDGAGCDDGDNCTNDTCYGGQCQSVSIVPVGSCDTDDSDECANGVYQCDASGLYCEEDQVDIPESCNGIDDDCDGSTDEDFGAGQPCTSGLGACLVHGQIACSTPHCESTTGDVVCYDGVPTCDAVPLAPHVEVCNGKDDDCDGLTDHDGASPARVVCPALETAFLTGPELTASSDATLTYWDPTTPERTTFECSFDGAGWAACDEGVMVLGGLAEGLHVLLVRSVGGDGQRDATPAKWEWKIDRTIPQTVIVSRPNNPAQWTTAEFAFDFADVPAIAGYHCKLDGAAYVACPADATFEDLGEGEHTLLVYVVSAAGVADPTPAKYTWSIDLSAPETRIVAAPDEGTAERTAHFTFDDPTDVATALFECRLDATAGGSWGDCSSGKQKDYSGLGLGVHTFEVRATDAVGHVDPTPATHTWTIIPPGPNTEITHGPSATGKGADADFNYDCPDDPALTTYDCRVDGGAWSACDGGHLTVDGAGLEIGQHEFQARACTRGQGIGGADVCDPLPAQWKWMVTSDVCPGDTIAPTISCTPLVAVACGTAVDPHSFAPVASDECAPVTVGWNAPDTFPIGTTSVAFFALDGNSNRAACATDVVITDAVAPVITCPVEITAETPIDACVVTPDLATASASDACAATAITLSHDAVLDLAPGTHDLTWRASDPSGNASTCQQRVTVVDRLAPSVHCGDGLDAGGGGDGVDGLDGQFSLPHTFTADASDACGADLTLVAVECRDADGAIVTGAGCPVTTEGGALTVGALGAAGEITVHWKARATDPSGNVTEVACAVVVGEPVVAEPDGGGEVDVTESEADDDGDTAGGDASDTTGDVDDTGEGDTAVTTVDSGPTADGADGADGEDDTSGGGVDTVVPQGHASAGCGDCSGGDGAGAASLIVGLLGLVVRRRRLG